MGSLLNRLGLVSKADFEALEATHVELRAALEAKEQTVAFIQRNYIGAQLSRHLQFMAQLESADREIRRDLEKLRAHSRDLVKNNPFMARFVQLVDTNVIGPDGIRFESEIRTRRGDEKAAWNDHIEEQFSLWGEACTVDEQNWLDAQHMYGTTLPTDGEVLVRMVRGFDNPWGFAIEFLDVDRLAHQYNLAATKTTNAIIMGVEVDGWGRRVAYHIWSAHPNDPYRSRELVRIPAAEIRHIYRQDRVQRSRGVPWAAPSMFILNLLGRYWNAEVVAANNEADRLGFLEAELGDLGREGAKDPTTVDIQSEHGTFIGLPTGITANIPDLKHPNSALGEFSRSLLKGAAVGMGVSAASLTGDLSDANYGSQRGGLLDERDGWRMQQRRAMHSFCAPIQKAWLEMAILRGAVKLPLSDFAQIYKPKWYPRGWGWIDPDNDTSASLKNLGACMTTLRDELGAQGKDWEDVLEQKAKEAKKASELGITLDFTGGKAPSAPSGPSSKPASTPKTTPMEADDDQATA